MNKLKLVLIAMGIIFTGVLVYLAVSIVMSLFWYLVVFGVILLAGVGAYKLLVKPEKRQIEQPREHGALADAQKLLKEYRRELAKKNE